MSAPHNSPQGTTSKPIIPVLKVPQPLLPASTKVFNINPEDELTIYKREYSRLLRDNQRLLTELSRVMVQKEDLQKKYHHLQVDRSSNQERKKRHRRSANEIIREFECNAPQCGKSYGTEASLIQHIKLKHADFYGSEQYEEHLATLRRRVTEAQKQKLIPHQNQQN